MAINRKNLIIHPWDKTTDCLKAVYDHHSGVLIRAIDHKPAWLEPTMASSDQVLLLGHGTSSGLLSESRKLGIDSSYAKYLQQPDNIYIFCNADLFVKENKLSGFCTGMFISEMGEADIFGIECSEYAISRSNQLFATIIGTFLINQTSPKKLVDLLSREYRINDNPVVEYNQKRLWAYEKGRLVNWTIDADMEFKDLPDKEG